MPYEPGPSEYVYRCPGCRAKVTYGDHHCRGCGRAFGDADVDAMKKTARLRGPDMIWQTGHGYHCPGCDALVRFRDRHCAHCGRPIDAEARAHMKNEQPDRNLVPLLSALLLALLAISLLT